MEIQKKEVSVNIPVADFEASVIVDSDAIVNDSKPDLLKILYIDPVVSITRADVLNGKMMVYGHVTYKVLYQPDELGCVNSITTGADFSHMEENPAFSEGMYPQVNAEVEHLESEIINSRKIKIRSVIALEGSVQKNENVMLPLDVAGDNLQAKHTTFGGYSRLLNKRDIITVSDLLSLPAGKPNMGSVLKHDAALRNKDVKIIAGKVIIKGDIKLCTLYTPEGQNTVEFCHHNMPFTEILDAEGVTEEQLCHVKTEIEDCDFSLATDSDGDIRNINASVRIGVKISADSPISENVVTDAYSLTDNLDISYTPITIKNPVRTSEFDHAVNCVVRPNFGKPIQAVYNMNANPVITSMTTEDGKMSVEGYLDLSCLCITADENCPIATHDEEVPFKIEWADPGCQSNMEPSAEIEVNHINYELGNAGAIDARIVLACNTQLYENGKINIVDELKSTGVAEGKYPSIVLYFVQKDDTLWDIAKRYHTKSEYIEELNGPDCNPPKCGSQLIIPRG
ncbi:MAG: SPOCS domain-containing protein [Monoglobales bacterium]